MVAAGVIVLVAVPSVRAADPLPRVAVPAVPVVEAPVVPVDPAVPAPPALPPVSVPVAPVPGAPAPPSVSTAPVAPPAPAHAGRTTTQLPSATPRSAPAAAGRRPAGAPSPSAGAGERRTQTETPTIPRQRREPSSRRLRRLLRPFAACLPSLRDAERSVLVRRAGLQGLEPQTRSEVARSLDASPTRIARLERRGLRRLRRSVRSGSCQAGTPPAGATATGSPVTRVSTAVGTSAGTTAAGTAAAPPVASAPRDRQAVKGESDASPGAVRGPVAAAAPRAVAAAFQEGRSFADDHPIIFGLVLLATGLAAALLVRELRRAV
jgi:hypothetical protein